MTQEEIEAYNERVLSEACRASQDFIGAWVRAVLKQGDGRSEAAVLVSSTGPQSMSVKGGG